MKIDIERYNKSSININNKYIYGFFRHVNLYEQKYPQIITSLDPQISLGSHLTSLTEVMSSCGLSSNTFFTQAVAKEKKKMHNRDQKDFTKNLKIFIWLYF